MLKKRREEQGGEGEEWGLDELSDLEEDSDDDDDVDEGDGDESEEEKEGKAEKVVKEAEQAEGENVAQRPDGDVDALADQLGQTHV